MPVSKSLLLGLREPATASSLRWAIPPQACTLSTSSKIIPPHDLEAKILKKEDVTCLPAEAIVGYSRIALVRGARLNCHPLPIDVLVVARVDLVPGLAADGL